MQILSLNIERLFLHLNINLLYLTCNVEYAGFFKKIVTIGNMNWLILFLVNGVSFNWFFSLVIARSLRCIWNQIYLQSKSSIRQRKSFEFSNIRQKWEALVRSPKNYVLLHVVITWPPDPWPPQLTSKYSTSLHKYSNIMYSNITIYLFTYLNMCDVLEEIHLWVTFVD